MHPDRSRRNKSPNDVMRTGVKSGDTSHRQSESNVSNGNPSVLIVRCAGTAMWLILFTAYLVDVDRFLSLGRAAALALPDFGRAVAAATLKLIPLKSHGSREMVKYWTEIPGCH